MLGGILDGLVGAGPPRRRCGRRRRSRRARPRHRHALRPVRAAGLLAPATSTPTSPRSSVRYDLDRAEFQAFKTALLDYLQRFVDEIARHMPQLADALQNVRPADPRAVRAGQRRAAAARRRGGDRAPRAGAGPGRLGRAARVVRRRAGGGTPTPPACGGWPTEAMRALLVNLRRIAAGGVGTEPLRGSAHSSPAGSPKPTTTTAHALWASAFGLYSCRHLGFAADDDGDPVPPTASWWRTPSAEVPVALRELGVRAVRGPRGAAGGLRGAKAARLAEREDAEREQELAAGGDRRPRGPPRARSASPTRRGRPCSTSTPARWSAGSPARARTTPRSRSQASTWSAGGQADPGCRHRDRRPPGGWSWSTSR